MSLFEITPDEFMPLAIEDDMLVLKNAYYVTMWTCSPLSFDAFDKDGISGIHKLFSKEVIEHPSMSGCFFSMSLIRRPVKNAIKSISDIPSPPSFIPDGVRAVLSYQKSHIKDDFVKAREEQIINKCFTDERFLAVSAPSKKQAKEAKEVFEKFASNIRLNIKLLNPYECFSAIYTQINPNRPIRLPSVDSDFGELPSLSEQIVVSDASTEYDGFKPVSMVLEPAASSASEIDPWAIEELLKKINMPFRYTINVLALQNQRKAKERLKIDKGIAASCSVFSSVHEENKAKANAISTLLNSVIEGEKVCKYNVIVQCWGEQKDAINLISSFSSKGFTLIRTKEIKNCWFVEGVSGLSMIGTGRLYTTSSGFTSVLFPFAGDVNGDTSTSAFLLQTRDGQPYGLSPTSSRMSRWGMISVGPSGSGKTYFISAFVNMLSRLTDSTPISIIDMAETPSYSGVVQALGGIEIRIDLNKALNPFDLPFPLTIPDKRQMVFLLETFFPALIPAVSHNAHWRKAIDMGIRGVYETCLLTEPKRIDDSEYAEDIRFKDMVTWNEAKEKFIAEKRHSLAWFCHFQAMPTIYDLIAYLNSNHKIKQTTDEKEVSNLCAELEVFITGSYETLFSKPTEIEHISWDTGTLLYFFLGPLRKNKSVLAPVYAICRKRILDAKNASKSPRCLIITDEFHNLIDHPSVLKEIDDDFKQGRTQGIAPLLISQSARHFDIHGYDFINNASIKILMRHIDPSAQDKSSLEVAAEVFSLKDTGKKLLESLRFHKGEFSEALILMEDGAAVVRYAPSPIEHWYSTSDPDDRMKRDATAEKFLKEGIPYRQAIQMAVSELVQEKS